ncbi:MAG TPA: DNA gyrase subunit A, partial [Candidatus Paceibacterota bacterium]|nr:DNA gyrase subunit A [Candidatus Paceibacterota bacterium]
DVLGKYHPHGDSSVYEAMVGMAQDFSYRYPLIIGQGNWGSIDGDPAAAYRYTEAKMSRIAGEFLRDIEKETVPLRPNFDNTRNEPTVLPTSVPALFLNGTIGIAVGMATNIPSHNLGEVILATRHLIDNPTATTEDLLEFVKGPDFPTGGLAYSEKDINHSYATGRGGVVVRGETEIVEQKNGQFEIIVTSLPYKVNKANLIVAIADLVRDKKLEGIRDIRDESTTDIRIVIELKSNAHPQKVLNFLYKNTQLETAFHYNMVALVDGVPETLSLKSYLAQFITYRKDVVRKRTEYDLKVAEEREHILLGLSKALDHIDKVIKLIKSSKSAAEAKENLMKQLKFTERQAIAILEMRLQKLAALERQAILDELAEKQKLIKELKGILANPKRLLGVISQELEEIKAKYADPRRTKIIKGGIKEIKEEDLIPEKESVLVFTAGGYVKRTDPKEYRVQRRGGIGVVDLETKEEDFITILVYANTHDNLLFFTNLGKAYQIKMYDIPEGKRATRGKSIMNFLALDAGEKVTSILAVPKKAAAGESLFMMTKMGVAKKVAAASFQDVRRSGLIAIKLQKNDELKFVVSVNKGDEIILATTMGQSIRFKESDIRQMGRGAGGVRGVKLGKNDEVVGVDVVKKGTKGTFLTISENGLGKQTELEEYKTQKRGGSGIKTAKVTPKTGRLIVGRVVGEETELIVMSKKGQVIRTEIKNVPVLGRQTQGVAVMKLRAGDGIASFTYL